MGLRVDFDVDAIVAKMSAVGKDATNAGFGALVEGAGDVQELAREYAPLEDADLEQAIIVDPVRADQTVYVGIDVSATDELGNSVAKYGEIMHEQQVPYGTGAYGLGKLSAAKDAGRGVVGGKFLERAYLESLKGVVSKVGFTVKRILRS